MKSDSARYSTDTRKNRNVNPNTTTTLLPFWTATWKACCKEMRIHKRNIYIYLCGDVNSHGNNQKKLVILPEKKTNQNCHSVFYYVFIVDIEARRAFTALLNGSVCRGCSFVHTERSFLFIRYVFIRMLLSHFIFPMHRHSHSSLQYLRRVSLLCVSLCGIHLCFINDSLLSLRSTTVKTTTTTIRIRAASLFFYYYYF